MTRAEAYDFVIRFADRMCPASLSEETGIAKSTIEVVIRRKGLQPITKTDENILFLKEWRGKLSRERAMKILEIKEHRFFEIVQEAGLDQAEFKTESMLEKERSDKITKGVVLSVREILGSYMVDDRLHYNRIMGLDESQIDW